jgi:hypothetical protein
MDFRSSASSLTMKGFMAAWTAAMIASAPSCPCGGAWLGLLGVRLRVLPSHPVVSPMATPRLGGAFLGRGVGDGLVRDGVVGAGVAGRPRGVVEGDVLLAARGGFSLVATGVDGPGSGAASEALPDELGLEVVGVGGPAGVAPDAVRFLPAVGVGRPSNGPSKTALRPIDIAADIKYAEFRFLTASAISASCVAARRSIWTSFHSRHFSSTSMVASLAISFSALNLR